MSQTWVNADMSAMLPAGTMDLLNSLEATVNTAKIPLEFVNNIQSDILNNLNLKKDPLY